MQQEDLLIREIQKIGLLIAAMISKRREGFAQECVNLGKIIFKELLPDQTIEPPLTIDESAVSKLTEAQIMQLQQATYQTGKAYHDMGQATEATSYMQLSLKMCQIADQVSHTFSFERESIKQELTTLNTEL